MRLVLVMLALLPAVAEAGHDANLVSYGAYGTTEVIVVRGRAARGHAVADASDKGKVRKVWATAKAFAGRDIEHAQLRIRDAGGGPAQADLRADDDGFFEARLPGKFPAGARAVEVTLVEKGWSAEPLRVTVDVVDGAAGLLAVTDIDDTIIETGVTGGKLALVARIASSAVSDIKPQPGAAAALSAFARSGVPVIYLSASPIEIAPRLMSFLELREFPAGALFLRHYEDDGIGDPTKYKRARIDRLLADFPGRKLVLFGDNGEHDRDVFAAVAKDTGRVAYSYIRRTLPDKRAIEGQLLFDTWAEVAAHARSAGMLK